MLGVGAALLLALIGAILGAWGLVAVGVIVGLVWILRTLWSRFGLRRLSYERRLTATRATVGDEIGLELVVRNRKLLPVPWLAVDDVVTAGAAVAGRRLEAAEQPGLATLRTTWTLGWFERVTRRLRIVADRRGVYDFRSVRLRVADLFARDFAIEEHADPLRYRVVPRSVPVRSDAPLSTLPGTAAVRHGLHEDPARFAGVRPYQAGDPFRRIHWKASARLGRPVSRRYDPGRERELVIALDAQTVPGPSWLMQYEDDLVEGLCTAAMSLARSAVAEGIACGLIANGYVLEGQRSVRLAPSAAPSQVERIADQLAALSRWASLPFGALLGEVGARLRPGTNVVALSAREPDEFLPVLRRLAASGYPVRLLALGPSAPIAVERARAVGVPARIARLDPDWRRADALDLVG